MRKKFNGVQFALALSTTALIVALLGSTPLGNAAQQAIPPLATHAKTADLADNAKRLNGFKASARPRGGTIPVLLKNAKLPAAIGAVGPQGLQGPQGPQGQQGSAGPSGATNVTIRQANITNNGSGTVYTGQANCQAGEKATGGGFFLDVNGSPYISTPQPNGGGSPTGWYVAVITASAPTTIGRVLVVCAAP